MPELDELQKDCTSSFLSRILLLTSRPVPLDAANDVHCSMEIFKRLRSLSPHKDTPVGADVPWYLPKDIEEVVVTDEKMRLQWRRAHELWHKTGMALERMCAEMRVKNEGVSDEGPLKSSTVMYVFLLVGGVLG